MVVANTGGSVTSLVATLTVYVPPGIQTQPQNLTVTQGHGASFSVAANGSAPLNYQWNFDGTNVSGATNATLALTNAQGTNAGSYTVVVTNPAGSVTSQVASLTVNVPPGITTQPQSQAVVQGQNGSFSVVATGTANLSYQWYFNGSSLGWGGAHSATLTLNNIGSNNAGSYTVVVNNNYGSATSAVATLTLIVPPTITSQPQSQAVAAGQSALFSVGASGAETSYQWKFNSTAVSGATNASLNLTNVQTTNAGSYTVVVTNSAGSITSAVATLTVTNPVVILSPVGGGGLPPNGFTFQLSVPTGLTYVILVSTDFQVWTPIATNLATTGSVLFTDPAAANHPTRFYRAMVR